MFGINNEHSNFECYDTNLGTCPEEGDSPIFNTVMSAAHELRLLDQEARGLAANESLSREGKLRRLAPLQKNAADEAVCQEARIAEYSTELKRAEDRLFSPPAIESTNAVMAHDDGERRRWFEKLSDVERFALAEEMRRGDHVDIVMALGRSPTPGPGRALGLEIWRDRMKRDRGPEVQALAARQRALEWGQAALTAIARYAAVTPWSTKPAETAIDKMIRGRAGRSTSA